MQLALSDDKHKNFTVLIVDDAARFAMPKSKYIHVVFKADDKRLENAHSIFVITTGLKLPQVAEFIKDAHKRKSVCGLLIKQETNQNWIPQLLEKANLKSLKNILVYADDAVMRRVLAAWAKYQAQGRLIADVAVLGDTLLVSDCAFNSYQIGFKQIKALSKLSVKERNDFVISDEGGRISWPSYDIDIGLETIKNILNPQPDKALALKHDIAYGLAIVKLRKRKKIRQYQIRGLSERHLRRIETGKQHASVKTLEILCKAHGMKLNDYLNELAVCAGKALATIT